MHAAECVSPQNFAACLRSRAFQVQARCSSSLLRGGEIDLPDPSSGLRARCDATTRRLQRFGQMKKQLESLDRDTIREVDSACKEISRNCELLTIIKQNLDSIYRSTRCVIP